MRRFVSILPATLACAAFAFVAGCSSGPEVPDALANEKTFLDDTAMVSFNADLTALGAMIDRGEFESASALRAKISEGARGYQRALASALYDDDSRARRAMAAILLGFTGDSNVIGPLVDIVADMDEEQSVRLNAVLGLTELDDKLRDYKDHKKLMNTLGATMIDATSSMEMRRACVYAYATAFDARHGDTMAPVRGRFTNDPALDVQVAAIYALGDVNDKSAVPTLASVGLNHPEAEIRATTAISLGRIQDPEKCIPPLVTACRDDDPLVRREAMDALSRHHNHKPEQVYTTLLAGLSDFDSLVREAAALSLARLNDVRAIEPLLQATGDRTAIVRQAAAHSLGTLITAEREKEAYPLIDMLGDSNPEVGITAMESLKRIVKEDFGSDQTRWRTHFHVKYPETNPAMLDDGKPKPRISSGINSSGARRTGGTNTNRNNQWNQNRNNNNQNRNNWNQNRNNTNRNNTPGRR